MRDTASASGELELLDRARQGDRSAYGQIVGMFQDRLFNAVLRITGNADSAADVTQEAFTRGLTKIENFRGEAGIYTWLFRIAMNLAISDIRKDKRHRTFSIDQPDALPGSGTENQAQGLIGRLSDDRSVQPLEKMEQQERHDQLLAALGRIDPEDRSLLVMRDIEGFDYKQMTTVLDMPLGTLKSRLFRARLALRDELKKYFEE